MELELITSPSIDRKSEQGKISVDGVFSCFSLELLFTNGLAGSAISPGCFPIVLLPSPKFEQEALVDTWVAIYAKLMPHIIVPDRTNVMIHWGNDAENTDGCVLTGMTSTTDFIGSSRCAFATLYNQIKEAAKQDNCFITVQRNRV